MSFNSAVSGRQISCIISVTAVYKGTSQESTQWLETVIAIKLLSACQADVIKICRVKTHSSTITDLFLLEGFNLGLLWLRSTLMARNCKDFVITFWVLLAQLSQPEVGKKVHGKNEVRRHQWKMHYLHSWLYSSSYTRVDFPLGRLTLFQPTK